MPFPLLGKCPHLKDSFQLIDKCHAKEWIDFYVPSMGNGAFKIHFIFLKFHTSLFLIVHIFFTRHQDLFYFLPFHTLCRIYVQRFSYVIVSWSRTIITQLSAYSSVSKPDSSLLHAVDAFIRCYSSCGWASLLILVVPDIQQPLAVGLRAIHKPFPYDRQHRSWL